MIHFEFSDKQDFAEANWSLASYYPSLPVGKNIHQEIMPCSFLAADGAELNLIREKFTNIPITRGHQVIWKGEMADFVYTNLRILL